MSFNNAIDIHPPGNKNQLNVFKRGFPPIFSYLFRKIVKASPQINKEYKITVRIEMKMTELGVNHSL
ncbi:MAG: hypothetical protein ACJAS3_000584 [Roseivirga sp.]|jgi:hypothetical protein